MDREDIIKLAREAGMEQDGDNFFSPSHEEIDVHITDLERFAAIVAAAEREKVRSSMKKAFRRMAGLIRADEREACAKVCEAYTDNDGGTFIDHEGHGYACAAAIRARGETK